MRSLDVAVWLRKQGVESAQSLAGGIERWSVEMTESCRGIELGASARLNAIV